MRRILVVDDDPHVGPTIRTWLQRQGFRVAVADGGTSGLAALDNSTFDLMIVDVFMPNMRGFEAIRVFHDRAPAVPLIAIFESAFSDPEIFGPDFLRIAAKFEAACCLRKPFRPATLLDVIDGCLSEAEPHRRHIAVLSAVANAFSEQRNSGAPGGKATKKFARLNGLRKPSTSGGSHASYSRR